MIGVRLVIASVAALLLMGCVKPTIRSHVPREGACHRDSIGNPPRKVAVFFDGTSNNEGSDTNISKLRNIATRNSRCRINTLYIDGVGVGAKVPGAATGWGIGYRVRKAYTWLGENLDVARGDSLFVFGFSRGAYTARIFAALVYSAGVPDLRSLKNEKSREEMVSKVYSAYKGDYRLRDRKDRARRALGGLHTSDVDITFMGLWETVEALGAPDYEENIDIPNPLYGDQLCNVRKAAHAMSLDDDRARIFTPILLTRQHLVEQCEKAIDINSVVEEVWFSGAHSDVGGRTGTEIDGVSLNWMLDRLTGYGLVPDGTRVEANPFGKTTDPEAPWHWGILYRFQRRDIPRYVDSTRYNPGRLKVHEAVVRRLETVPVNRSWESLWFETKYFFPCFIKKDSTMTFVGGSACKVDVVP